MGIVISFETPAWPRWQAQPFLETPYDTFCCTQLGHCGLNSSLFGAIRNPNASVFALEDDTWPGHYSDRSISHEHADPLCWGVQSGT